MIYDVARVIDPAGYKDLELERKNGLCGTAEAAGRGKLEGEGRARGRSGVAVLRWCVPSKV
jgi:hypothetical protein